MNARKEPRHRHRQIFGKYRCYVPLYPLGECEAQESPHRPLSPEQNLCLAVFDDALTMLKKGRHRTCEEMRELEDAEMWFAGQDALISFADVCAILGWDPGWALARVHREVQEAHARRSVLTLEQCSSTN